MSCQDRFAPHAICYGCGPANAKGLRIKSDWESDPDTPENGRTFVCRYTPAPHHQAFPGVINGGIIGTLLDCHANWCAAMTMMEHHEWPEAMCTVTADFHVKLRAPTPAGAELMVKAWSEEPSGDSERLCKVRAEIWADTDRGRKITATCTGTFIAVQEGHPAWHRWG